MSEQMMASMQVIESPFLSKKIQPIGEMVQPYTVITPVNVT